MKGLELPAVAMWLLSTDRAELHEFHGPDDCQLQLDGGYAILSHVWEGMEQTFKEIQDLRAACEKEGKNANPRDRASVKVRQCCLIAQRHGFKWVWDDTCCINKDSSSELSEAINSMFRYYSLAGVCFAYLCDVSYTLPSELGTLESPFRKSKWHTRGWTLQELIAPPFLVFLSKNWDVIGTKMELAELLKEITKVPVPVLQLAEPVDDSSVACRMSWAAMRRTTRVEDKAYCLMGIFSVNMPTMYGEEERAFLRLQEEIMKRSVDTSLFAWDDPVQESIEQEHRDSTSSSSDDSCHHTASRHFLLAPSPAAFSRSTDVRFSRTLIKELQRAKKVKTPPGPRPDDQLATASTSEDVLPCIPSFSVTPYGIRAHVPIMDVIARSFSVAWLGCLNGKNEVVGLCITPCHSSHDSTRQLYHTGYPGSRSRVVTVPKRFSDALLWRQDCAEWRDIHIANQPLPTSTINKYTPSDYTLSPPFRFPMQSLKACLGEHGYLVHVSPVPFNWDGFSPVTFKFHAVHEYAFIKIYIMFGRCSCSQPRDVTTATTLPPGPHWSLVVFDQKDKEYTEMPPHVCSKHHIVDWPNRTRLFSNLDRAWNVQIKLTLSFKFEDPHSPITTFVPNITHSVEVGRDPIRRELAWA